MKSFILLACLSAALAMPWAARAAPLYTVTVVAGADSVAYDVNNHGEVVGYMPSGAGYHAFLYSGSALTDIGTLGGAGSFAYSLNDSGTVVGDYALEDGNHAFTYANGNMTALPIAGYSEATAINSAGTITGTGSYLDSEGFYQPHAYTYANGVVTDLGGLPNGYGTHGSGINDHGHLAVTAEVYGPPNWITDPFLYHDGVLTNLGNFGGAWSYAWSLNNQDQVVGSAGSISNDEEPFNLYPYHAFLYDSAGMHDLGTMAFNGNSSAYGINELGQVVGWTDTNSGERAFLYADGAMTLLDTLIDPASGWSITAANGINEQQQIAGRACRAGICYAVRLDLASQVPEPGAGALLGVGLMLLVGYAKRRNQCVSLRRRGYTLGHVT